MRRPARPDVAQLLRGHRHRTASLTASLGHLTARRSGPNWIILDIDRINTTDFTPAAAQAGTALNDPLGTLHAYARDVVTSVPQFRSTGYLHAPLAAADILLTVLLALDAGVTWPAETITPAITQAVAPLRALPTLTAKRRAAPATVAAVIDHLKGGRGDPQRGMRRGGPGGAAARRADGFRTSPQALFLFAGGAL